MIPRQPRTYPTPARPIPTEQIVNLFMAWLRTRANININPTPTDLLDDLNTSTKLAAALTSNRWHTIARLLELTDAVQHWQQLGDAIGVTAVEVEAGFNSWLSHTELGVEKTAKLWALSGALTVKSGQAVRR